MGPVDVFAPGFERETRGRKVKQSKCWIMVSVCPTTKLTNLQVVESSSASGIMSGIIRLGCEVGVPSKMFIDQDRASMCGFKNAEFDLRNLQLTLERKYSIDFEVCPVQGHNMHGRLRELSSQYRSISRIQGCLLPGTTLLACRHCGKSVQQLTIGLSFW